MNDSIVKQYLAEVLEMYRTDHAREHAYRPALKSLFKEISGLHVVNDPKRSEHGAPDFVFLKNKTIMS